jgi:catalase (peroxidase I)
MFIVPVLEPKADGFRNYQKQYAVCEELLLDKAQLLT